MTVLENNFIKGRKLNLGNHDTAGSDIPEWVEGSPEQPGGADFAEYIRSVRDDPSIPTGLKKEKLKEIKQNARAEIEKHQISLAEASKKLAFCTERIACLEQMKEWIAIESPRLEKNDCSRLHKLVGALKTDGIVFGCQEDEDTIKNTALLSDVTQTLVVRHDWASAFGPAIDELEKDFVLPYPRCAFEFRISGKTVIVVMIQEEGETPLVAAPFVEAAGIWCRCDTLDCVLADKGARAENSGIPVMKFLWRQIRAVCIALDTDIARGDVRRQSEKLNHKRISRGLLPLFDYHVVDLSRRSSTGSGHGSVHTGVRVRLHFRRGHWRHYETHEKWIRWMLVGNPDLGYIDKYYLL